MVQKDLSSKPIEGRHKTLQCQVVSEGKPAATQYKWYRNNIDITEAAGKYERFNNNELVIRNLNKDDDGSYGCRIENDAGLGIQKGTYKLEVLCKATFIFTIFQGYYLSIAHFLVIEIRNIYCLMSMEYLHLSIPLLILSCFNVNKRLILYF